MPKIPANVLGGVVKTAITQATRKSLWAGPCDKGKEGGITFSLLNKWLVCKERFRLYALKGLRDSDRWNHLLGYGELWHLCEEFHAGKEGWEKPLEAYCIEQMNNYPMQREEIRKWASVCSIQFPEYIKHWKKHPDTKRRVPLLQEKEFRVPYKLPSGRVVYLRGKWDSVDLIDGEVWLQENKTKGNPDERQIKRQLKYDLQTMIYLIALEEYSWTVGHSTNGHKVAGVRYNVIKRPLSGGKGTITMHKEKRPKKGKYKPAETESEFYERLRRDYIAADPQDYFMRWKVEVSEEDRLRFQRDCLDPILEQVCWWWEEVMNLPHHGPMPPLHFRMPFGVYSPLLDARAGETDYDVHLESGSMSGLRYANSCFPELVSAT